MDNLGQAVTPAEEVSEIEVPETEEVQTEEGTETETEAVQVDDETTESIETSDVDFQQKYESLEKEVRQLKNFIRSREEESEESGIETPDLPKDVQEFLREFAENPHDTLKKVIDGATKPYERTIREMQQQAAIDYIHMQKDFTPEMYDDLLYIVEGPERNRYFNFNNQSVKLKDLPPRQKAEAALQIYRGQKENKDKTINRPKPVTTTKSKPTSKKSSKPDEMLSAEEFAKKYGIKTGAL